jgi:uncharacterized membrane protein
MRKPLSILGGTCLVYIAIQALLPAKANAWFDVCNRSNRRVPVAFGYRDFVDNRELLASSSSSSWISEGWWSLNPGNCTRVYPHELWRRNRYYYVFAKSTDGKLVWGGNTSFCVVSRAFTFLNVGNLCRDADSANGLAEPRDARYESFQQVDIGGGKVQNFTYNLN